MPVVAICPVLEYMSILKEIGIGMLSSVCCIDPVTAAVAICLPLRREHNVLRAPAAIVYRSVAHR